MPQPATAVALVEFLLSHMLGAAPDWVKAILRRDFAPMIEAYAEEKVNQAMEGKEDGR